MRTKLVCQYHRGKLSGRHGMLPTVYSDSLEAREWKQTEHPLFTSLGVKPVWICPKCQKWLENHLLNRLAETQANTVKKHNGVLRELEWRTDDARQAYQIDMERIHRGFEKEFAQLGMSFVDGQWVEA